MIIQGLPEQIAIATFGGFCVEVLHWYMLSRKEQGIAEFKKSFTYWAITGLMILIGGSMPFFYLSGPSEALLCFHLGATAPLLLQKLATIPPEPIISQGSEIPIGRTRRFFTW